MNVDGSKVLKPFFFLLSTLLLQIIKKAVLGGMKISMKKEATERDENWMKERNIPYNTLCNGKMYIKGKEERKSEVIHSTASTTRSYKEQ